MTDYARIFEVIDNTDDAEKVERIYQNARAKGDFKVLDYAFQRLINLRPSQNPDTVEFEFWRTIHAFEQMLTDERGRTTRLSRTRQKINRVGEKQTLIDLTLSNKPSDGFTMLVERGFPEYTAEAIVIRNETLFEDNVVTAAKVRLENYGIGLDSVR